MSGWIDLGVFVIFFFFFFLSLNDRKKTAFGTVEIHRLTFDETRDCIVSFSVLFYKDLAEILLPK